MVYPYSSDARYLYLVVLLLIGLTFGATGQLKTGTDAVAAGGLTLASWVVLWLIRRPT